MSVFRVNNNTLAMSALRNLQSTGLGIGQSMNRLSTGLRINNAGDDPAGLIVSEGLRAQISGIDQALRNNQDAINYSKTAEAALDEVSRLLRDARSLSVASGNSATLDDAQRQANQNQLSSIVQSISRIAETTAFGRKKLLDGSSGTMALSTSGGNVSNMTFSGVFNAFAVTQNSTVTVDMTTAAERASVATTATFGFATTTVNAGSFTVNGVTFNTTSADTIANVVQRINASSKQTGVTATWEAGGSVNLRSHNYGSDAIVSLVDSTGILMTQAGAISDAGVNAVADVTIDLNGATAGGLQTVSFASGFGLNLRDIHGNSILLTENGNLQTAASAWGTVTAGNATFQVGGNANDTTSLSLGNFAASELGKGVIANQNLSSITIMTAANATEALQILDKAIDDVSSARGQIGNFMRNILESNTRSLAIQRENLAATESNIRDVDVAAEMATFTRYQILQQSGVAMLAQANQAPQAVLRLLQG
jgi:flagellin